MAPLHTPGPWVADLTGPFTLGGDSVSVEALTPDGLVSREICTCLLDTDVHPGGAEWLEDAANVRLITAAPDLYAAVRKLLAISVPANLHQYDPAEVEVIDFATAALAKVDGGAA